MSVDNRLLFLQQSAQFVIVQLRYFRARMAQPSAEPSYDPFFDGSPTPMADAVDDTSEEAIMTHFIDSTEAQTIATVFAVLAIVSILHGV